MKRKKMMLWLLTVVFLFAAANTLSVYADQYAYLSSNSQSYGRLMPNDADIDSGSYSGAHFTQSYYLKKSTGAYVNFWIKNTGSIAVTITINGKNERTFAPGESGHISAPVDPPGGTYNFKAIPTSSSKYISIEFRIAQRDY